MKTKIAVLLAVLVIGLFLAGCSGTTSGGSTYNSYNQPQGQQNQYVGGGCGVAPSAEYTDVAGVFNVENSAA